MKIYKGSKSKASLEVNDMKGFSMLYICMFRIVSDKIKMKNEKIILFDIITKP